MTSHLPFHELLFEEPMVQLAEDLSLADFFFFDGRQLVFQVETATSDRSERRWHTCILKYTQWTDSFVTDNLKMLVSKTKRNVKMSSDRKTHLENPFHCHACHTTDHDLLGLLFFLLASGKGVSNFQLQNSSNHENSQSVRHEDFCNFVTRWFDV